MTEFELPLVAIYKGDIVSGHGVVLQRTGSWAYGEGITSVELIFEDGSMIKGGADVTLYVEDVSAYHITDQYLDNLLKV